MPHLLPVRVEQRHDDVGSLQDRANEFDALALVIRRVGIELLWRLLLGLRDGHHVCEIACGDRVVDCF